jgi:hypothetical protein
MPATTNRPSRPARRHAAAAPAAIGALLLAVVASGCSPPDDKFPPACPGLSLVRDGGTLTRFAGNGRDATDIVLRARITEVPAKCEREGDKMVKSTLNIEAEVSRGPAAHGEPPPAAYFIAVAEAGKVLQEQDFPLLGQFPANVDKVRVRGEDVELLVPVSKTKSAAAYHIYIGFRLRPDELAYNRAHPAP